MTPAEDPSIAALPGADLVRRGLVDLARGDVTAESALCEVARTRLRSLGLPMPEASTPQVDAELRLYELLGERHPERDPYPLYCAWLEQLDSFVWALTRLRERR